VQLDEPALVSESIEEPRAEVLEALRTSPDTFKRWALPQKQGALLGATLGELPVPKAVNALTGGEVDAAGAAKRAAD
jgi:multiple sugar transport system substrate-binding protein